MYYNAETLDALAERDRLAQVLVRCHGCRFVCSAQDAKHIIDALEYSHGDHTRDVQDAAS